MFEVEKGRGSEGVIPSGLKRGTAAVYSMHSVRVNATPTRRLENSDVLLGTLSFLVVRQSCIVECVL